MHTGPTFTDPPPRTDRGLVFAIRMDPDAPPREVGWDELDAPDAVTWIHLDRTDPDAQGWLRGQAGISPEIADALLEEDTRPRLAGFGTARLAILRGINHNPGAEANDMIAVRCLVEEHRIITLRMYRVMAVRELRQALGRGEGPRTPGGILAEIASGLVNRIEPVVAELRDTVDALEDAVERPDARDPDRDAIGQARRDAIFLRRFIAPQRDAIALLASDASPLFTDDNRLRYRELADSLTRAIEDLDSARDRAAVMSEQAAAELTERLSKRTYTLTVVAAIFLPLGFVTGLLGINVGGLPLAQSAWGFAIVCLVLAILTTLLVLVMRKAKWI